MAINVNKLMEIENEILAYTQQVLGLIDNLLATGEYAITKSTNEFFRLYLEVPSVDPCDFRHMDAVVGKLKIALIEQGFGDVKVIPDGYHDFGFSIYLTQKKDVL